MCSRPGRCPASTLPFLHALQPCLLIQLNHAVDLSIRMNVVGPRVLFFAFHVDGRNAEEVVLVGGKVDLTPAIFGTVGFDVSEPTFR